MTKEELLKEATKRTLNIIEGSPLHNAVMKAMEEYAQQQVENCTISDVVVSSSNVCTDSGEDCSYNCSGLCKERC